jgi:hypothetical protein
MVEMARVTSTMKCPTRTALLPTTRELNAAQQNGSGEAFEVGA